MSSILKALKKLENEYPSSGYDRPWLKEIGEKETFFDRLAASVTMYRQRYVVFAAVLLILIVSAAVIFKVGYFKETAAPLLSEKQQVEAVPSALPPQNMAPAPSAPSPQESVRIKAFDHPRMENRNLPSAPSTKPINKVLNTREPAEVPPSAVETAMVPSRQPLRPQTATKTPSSFSSLPSGQDTRPAAEDSAFKISQPSKPEGTVAAKILRDVNVKLQAISWSENPERRLAVINNSIVRQGDRSGNYVVQQINKDDVLVRQGNEIWMLPFRPR